jgi:hypothetical protein
VFEDIRQAFRDLLRGNVPPEERHVMLAQMKDSLVRARLALDDLRAGVDATRKRVLAEQAELETVRRRKGLAQGIGDTETVGIAEKFETQHAERAAVLQRKLDAQESELALVEREVDEMRQQLKAASAGVGSGLREGAVPPPGADADLGAEGGDARADLERELGGMDRASRRAAVEAEAEARLADLKRRMGK